MNGLRIVGRPHWQLIALLAGFCLPATAAAEAPSSAAIVDVSLGYAGHYKVGYWVPVYVSFEHQGRGGPLTVEVTVPDGDGMPGTTSVRCQAAGSDTAERIDVELYCKIGRINGDAVITIRDADRLLVQTRYPLDDLGPAPLPSDTPLFVAIGEVTNFLQAISEHSSKRTASLTVAQLTTGHRWPTKWYGYDGVDRVIVCGSRPETMDLLRDGVAVAALAEWVRNGGDLLLCVGSNAEQLLGAGAPLARFAPGKFVGLLALQKLTPLETYAEADDPLFKEDNIGRAEDFLIPYYQSVNGTVLVKISAEGRSIPLVLRRVIGFGQVTYLAVDLEQPEFEIWNGTRRLVGKLVFTSPSAKANVRSEVPGELAHVGYDDLSGQLRAALDHFEQQGVKLIPFVALLLFGFFYMLLIAPGDYFFLKRVLKRMELTWITFPTLVVIACLGSYYLAKTAKGDRQLLNQAELIDVDISTGQVRATCWFSIFSPGTQRYDLEALWNPPIDQPPDGTAHQPETDNDDQMIMSWLGLPGRALGGMQSLAATPQFRVAYRYGPELESMNGVPIQIWSTKCFTVRYQGRIQPPVQAALGVRETGVDRFIKGKIVNNLDVALLNCTLFHDRWVYSLGTIEPGKTVEVNRDVPIRSIRNHLTRYGEWRTESDEQRNDVPRIFDRMMFYDKAGGRDATPLKNRYLTHVDMTDLLSAQRAVLVANIGTETFDLKSNQGKLSYPGALRAATYRFLMPVERQ